MVKESPNFWIPTTFICSINLFYYSQNNSNDISISVPGPLEAKISMLKSLHELYIYIIPVHACTSTKGLVLGCIGLKLDIDFDTEIRYHFWMKWCTL